MKKKLTFIGAFLCMMCFIGLGSANAAVAEWDRLDQPDVKDIFTGYINGLTALKDKVNISESSDMEGRPNTEILTISLENPVYGHYAM